MPFQLIEADITKVEVDVVVNAANEALQEGSGVCGAIFQAAGPVDLQVACDEIGSCLTGEAVITDGFQLPAKKIIHTVGPIWEGGQANEASLLKSCYENSLTVAYENGYESIAFPLISSGIYGYPMREAFEIAVSTIRTFLNDYELTVYLVIFDKKQFQVGTDQIKSITHYVDRFYKEESYYHKLQSMHIAESQPSQIKGLEGVVAQLDSSFSEHLLHLIDKKGMTDVETYKQANVDRRLFSKIRNTPNYTPQKKTVFAFAIALQLNIEETLILLEKAGYALSRSHKFDLIIRYFIEKEIYDIFTINEALFTFDEKLLGM